VRLVRPNFTTQSHTSRRKKAPSAALEGQADNSPGQASHERRPGQTAIPTSLPFFLFCHADSVGRQNRKKGMCSFLVSLPRRPCRNSVWLAPLANAECRASPAAAEEEGGALGRAPQQYTLQGSPSRSKGSICGRNLIASMTRSHLSSSRSSFKQRYTNVRAPSNFVNSEKVKISQHSNSRRI